MNQRHSDLIIRLANGINQRRMYFDSHPRVMATSREVAVDLEAWVRDSGTDAFTFGVYGGKFVRNGSYLVGPSIAGRALIEFAERLGCGGFSFQPPLTPEHLTTFFRLGGERSEECADLAEAQALLARHGIGHITLAPPLTGGGGEAPGLAGADSPVDGGDGALAAAINSDRSTDFTPLLQVYQSMYDTVATHTVEVHRNGRIDVDRAVEAGARLVEMADRATLDVMQFMRYPDYDSFTVGHSVRVAALAAMLANEIGWPREIRADVATAGLLHDLGKGRVPEEILFKPGRLDDEERSVIETHPAVGVQILLDNGEDSPLVMAATWGHHLRQDGGGYPAMPADYRRGSVAGLIHVCDVFEALTARRPYKNPMSPRRAYEVMLTDASSYHPRMLAALISAMGLYPPGSEVVLSDRRRAVVVARGDTLDRPLVRVTHDSAGGLVATADQPALDLRRESHLMVASIMSVGSPNVPDLA